MFTCLRLKERREKLGLSQREIAVEIGMDNANAISRWENGKRRPHKVLLEKWESVLNSHESGPKSRDQHRSCHGLCDEVAKKWDENPDGRSNLEAVLILIAPKTSKDFIKYLQTRSIKKAA